MELRWLVVLVLGVVMRGGSDVAKGNPLRTDPESATKAAVTIDDGEYRTSSIFKLLQTVATEKPPFPIRPPQDGDGGERWKPETEPNLLGGRLLIGRDPRHLIEFFPLRPPRDNDGGGKPKPPPPYGALSPIGRDLDHLNENSPAATDGKPPATDPKSATTEAVTTDNGDHKTRSVFRLLQAVTTDKPAFPIRPPRDSVPRKKPDYLGARSSIGRDLDHLIKNSPAATDGKPPVTDPESATTEAVTTDNGDHKTRSAFRLLQAVTMDKPAFPIRPPRDSVPRKKPDYLGAHSSIGRDLDHLIKNSPAATDGKPPATDPESATTKAVTTDNGDHKTRSVFRLLQAVTTDKPNFPNTTPQKRVEERSANGSQGVKQPSSYNLGSRSSIGRDLDHLIEAFPIKPPRDSVKQRKPDRHGAGSLIGRDLDHLIEATGDAQPMANAQNTSLETISTTFQTPPMPTSAESHMNHFLLDKEIGIVCNCVFCVQLHIAP